MKISAKARKYANQVVSKYTRNTITVQQIHQMYDELAELGITFIITGDNTEVNSHPYEIDDVTVENSRVVFGVYYPNPDSNRFELTCYFS